jgi:murein L,D-transpeptidase YcbB/YkuD
METALRILSISFAVVALWSGLGAAARRQEITWLDERGRLTEDARIAVNYLQSVEDDGLESEDFDARQLEVLAANLQASDEPSAGAVAFDTQLTRNILKYFRHLHLGRVDPRQLGFEFDTEEDAHDFEALLRAALARHQLPQTITDLAPPFAQYQNLRRALRQYRETDPSSPYVRQIELAMERLRWLPDLNGTRLVVINIPMFRLWAFEEDRADGTASIEMNVIVGRATTTRSPVFDADLRSIVFRPSWNVPESIVRNEILPALRRDPRYLEKHDMELTRSGGRVSVRQRPGPGNALGLVKFMFPNPHNVYMHATPVRELFGEARRDFSHGCVRVEDPVALAVWALADEGGWSREQVVAAMEATTTQTVVLRRPVRVVLFYTTALYTADTGAVRFADDIYGYDARLETALQARRTGLR